VTPDTTPTANADDLARLDVAELRILPLRSDAALDQQRQRALDVSVCAASLDPRDPALVKRVWEIERNLEALVTIPTGDGIRLRRASTITPEAVRWVYDDRIPLGAPSLLVGTPGEGKSTLLIDYAARLTRGTLPGDYYGRPVAVAIATAEDAIAQVVVPRLMAAGANRDLVHLVTVQHDGATGALSLTPGVIADLGRLVRDAGVRMLGLDPLVAFLPGKIDTHRDAAVRQILAPLARLAEDAPLALVAVIHLNKSQVQEVLYRVCGSIGFVGAARSVLLVGHDPEAPDGPTRIVAHAKCNLGPLAPSQRFTIEGHDVTHGDLVIRTSRIIHGDDAPTVAARDLLGTADDHSALDDATEYLDALLGESPTGIEATAAFRSARRHGIADKTLRRAKSQLGVVSRHHAAGPDGTPARWSWHRAETDPEGARWPTIEFGHLAPAEHADDGLTGRNTATIETPTKVANVTVSEGFGHLGLDDAESFS
jgi:hypothetical protein